MPHSGPMPQVDEQPVRKPSLIRRARKDTAQTFRDRQVTFVFVLALLAIPGAVVPAVLNLDALATGWRIAISAGGVLIAPISATLLLFLVKLVTARRHQLEDRVADLEERVAEQRDQVVKLTEGDPEDGDRFVPAYQDLKVELNQSHGRIVTAIETGQLWGVMDALPTTEWKKHRTTLRDSPLYEQCAEAFAHVERINKIGRLRSREVRPNDGLPDGRDSIHATCTALTTAIRDARPRQP